MMNLKTAMAPVLAEQYSDMLSLDFRGRQSLLTSYSHSITDLMEWDTRIQTYIDGLSLLKDYSCAYFEAQLTSPLSRGDVFALGVFAAANGQPALLDGCFRLAQAMPHFLPVIAQIIEWIPATSPLWPHLSTYPALRVLSGWLRPDIQPLPPLTLSDISGLINQPTVTPALVTMLHRQGGGEYFSIVNTLVQSGDPRIVCGVLTAILTQHLPDGGQPIYSLLRQLMQAKNEDIRLQAARLALLCTHHPHTDTLTFIHPQTGDTRLYIQALGIAGTGAHIPRLREYFEVPEYARLSAAAVSTITGCSPEAGGWVGEASPQRSSQTVLDGEIPDEDADSTLSWPDAPAFDQWWRNKVGYFNPEMNFLGGQPATPSGMLRVLHSGAMALRPLAALRWQHITARTAFSLSAPAIVQKRQLQSFTTKDISL